MFLPTMPQDDLEDIKEALLAARQNNGGENPVFYRKFEGQYLHPFFFWFAAYKLVFYIV